MVADPPALPRIDYRAKLFEQVTAAALGRPGVAKRRPDRILRLPISSGRPERDRMRVQRSSRGRIDLGGLPVLVELRGIHAGDTPSRAQVVINPDSSGRLQPSLADFAGALGVTQRGLAAIIWAQVAFARSNLNGRASPTPDQRTSVGSRFFGFKPPKKGELSRDRRASTNSHSGSDESRKDYLPKRSR